MIQRTVRFGIGFILPKPTLPADDVCDATVQTFAERMGMDGWEAGRALSVGTRNYHLISGKHRYDATVSRFIYKPSLVHVPNGTHLSREPLWQHLPFKMSVSVNMSLKTKSDVEKLRLFSSRLVDQMNIPAGLDRPAAIENRFEESVALATTRKDPGPFYTDDPDVDYFVYASQGCFVMTLATKSKLHAPDGNVRMSWMGVDGMGWFQTRYHNTRWQNSMEQTAVLAGIPGDMGPPDMWGPKEKARAAMEMLGKERDER